MMCLQTQKWAFNLKITCQVKITYEKIHGIIERKKTGCETATSKFDRHTYKLAVSHKKYREYVNGP